jgi:hypothetical protein
VPAVRVWGYIILTLGVIFLVLLLLALLGGAHMGVVPFIVILVSISLGWTLVTSGKGLVRTQPAAAGTAGAVAAPPDVATVELPLTPQIAAAIVRQSASKQRIILYVALGIAVFFVGLGAVFGFTDASQTEGRSFFEVFGGLGVICAIMIYTIAWLTSLMPIRRDLRFSTILRTTGPVQVVPVVGGAMLRLADRAFLMNGREGMAPLSKLVWGTVDHSPHGHVILGAWAKDGRCVYNAPGYDASDRTT